MKKIIAMALTLALLLTLAGCGTEQKKDTWTTDSRGNSIHEQISGTVYYGPVMPITCPYNEKSVTLESIKCYQMQIDYSYWIYVVATLDVSKLDDSELHWLMESDMTDMAFLTSEKNGYDFDRMDTLGKLHRPEEGKIDFVYMISPFSSKENRYDFAGSEVCASFAIKQQETYSGENSSGEPADYPKEHTIHCTYVLEENLPDPETIDRVLYNYMVKWLEYDRSLIP